eukprot:Rmarinus@m.4160
MISFGLYFVFSVASAAGIVFSAFQSKEQFYPTVIHLCTDKICVLVLANLALAFMFTVARGLKTIFLGKLRTQEVERLYERSRDGMIEALLAVSLFREEFSAKFAFQCVLLFFVKGFQWLSMERIDFIEQTPNVGRATHFRLILLMNLLFVIENVFIMYSVSHILEHGLSYMIYFAFEYSILCIGLIALMGKYAFFFISQSLEGRWAKKGLYSFYLQLVADLLQLVAYALFFISLPGRYHLPLYVIRDAYLTFRAFQKRLTDFVRYRRITRNMDERFPTVGAAELASVEDRTCIVCREDMAEAKVLPCQHMFHAHCLCSWFEHRQTCPTCFESVDRPPRPRPQQARRPAPGAAPGAAPAAAAGVPGVPGVPGIPNVAGVAGVAIGTGGAAAPGAAPGAPLGGVGATTAPAFAAQPSPTIHAAAAPPGQLPTSGVVPTATTVAPAATAPAVQGAAFPAAAATAPAMVPPGSLPSHIPPGFPPPPLPVAPLPQQPYGFTIPGSFDATASSGASFADAAALMTPPYYGHLHPHAHMFMPPTWPFLRHPFLPPHLAPLFMGGHAQDGAAAGHMSSLLTPLLQQVENLGHQLSQVHAQLAGAQALALAADASAAATQPVLPENPVGVAPTPTSQTTGTPQTLAAGTTAASTAPNPAAPETTARTISSSSGASSSGLGSSEVSSRPQASIAGPGSAASVAPSSLPSSSASRSSGSTSAGGAGSTTPGLSSSVAKASSERPLETQHRTLLAQASGDKSKSRDSGVTSSAVPSSVPVDINIPHVRNGAGEERIPSGDSPKARAAAAAVARFAVPSQDAEASDTPSIPEDKPESKKTQ